MDVHLVEIQSENIYKPLKYLARVPVLFCRLDADRLTRVAHIIAAI